MEERGLVLAVVLILGIAMFASLINEDKGITGMQVRKEGSKNAVSKCELKCRSNSECPNGWIAAPG